MTVCLYMCSPRFRVKLSKFYFKFVHLVHLLMQLLTKCQQNFTYLPSGDKHTKFRNVNGNTATKVPQSESYFPQKRLDERSQRLTVNVCHSVFHQHGHRCRPPTQSQAVGTQRSTVNLKLSAGCK